MEGFIEMDGNTDLLYASGPHAAVKNYLQIPVASCDLFEDDALLINRLFFLRARIADGKLILSVSYEENTFQKDGDADLYVLDTTCGTTAPDSFSVSLT